MSVAPRLHEWTLDELHRLPDDGNKYELVRGELFVTPAPSNVHQTIIARLTMLLVPYVTRHRVGMVHHARSVVRARGSETEPDLFVRDAAPGVTNNWEDAPAPTLVVEVLSDSTRRRDLGAKRAYYMDDVGVPEYWIVDPETRTIRAARPGQDDAVVTDTMIWHPRGAGEPLDFTVADIFA